MKRPRIIDFQFGKTVYERGKFIEGYYNGYEAFGLCQYYFWHLGYKFQKSKNELKNFISNSDPTFNLVKGYKIINRVVKKAMKKKPEHCPKVVITKKEIETIQCVKNFVYQKFLFSLLCYAKRKKENLDNENKKYDNSKYYLHLKIVHKLCLDMGLKISESKLSNWLNPFYDFKLIEGIAGGVKDTRGVLVLYANDYSEENIILEPGDIPWEKYIEFCGGEKIHCKNCEKCIDKKHKNQKYCDECKPKSKMKLFCEICGEKLQNNFPNRKYCNICSKAKEKENKKERDKRYREKRRF